MDHLEHGVRRGAVAAAVAVCLLGGNAHSQPGCGPLTEAIPAATSCTQESQYCGNRFEVVRDTCGDLAVEYLASPNHCSNVGMLFYLDGSLVAATAPVGPGESTGTITLGPVTPGEHTIGMEGVGEEGGCNNGYLEGWAGTLNLTYCAVAPAVVQQPYSGAACPHGQTEFSVVLSGGGTKYYRWQMTDLDNAGSWINIYDGPLMIEGEEVASLSGTDTATLQIAFETALATSLSGRSVRCYAYNSCADVLSDAADLAVCAADFDCSGFVDLDDFVTFVMSFEAGTDDADFDGTGFVDTDDFDAFVFAFEAGC